MILQKKTVEKLRSSSIDRTHIENMISSFKSMLCINYANFILLYKIHVCILFPAFFVVEVYGRCCQCFSFTSLTSPSIKDTTSIEAYVSQFMHNRWFLYSLSSYLLSFTHENTPKKHFHACFPMPSIVFQLQQRMAILTLWIINKFSLLFYPNLLNWKAIWSKSLSE